MRDPDEDLDRDDSVAPGHPGYGYPFAAWLLNGDGGPLRQQIVTECVSGLHTAVRGGRPRLSTPARALLVSAETVELVAKEQRTEVLLAENVQQLGLLLPSEEFQLAALSVVNLSELDLCRLRGPYTSAVVQALTAHPSCTESVVLEVICRSFNSNRPRSRTIGALAVLARFSPTAAVAAVLVEQLRRPDGLDGDLVAHAATLAAPGGFTAAETFSTLLADKCRDTGDVSDDDLLELARAAALL